MTYNTPDHHDLIQRYYELLGEDLRPAPQPAQMHQRGALLYEIREARAYEVLGYSNFRAFCQATQRALGIGSYPSAGAWISIYLGFSAEQLRDSQASRRCLITTLLGSRRPTATP